jgi:alpha-D-ribose 1-methylphosphonate 5-triphosphate synthase subunit PhnL
VVVDLIRETKAQGVAILGIFHDVDARSRIADRELDLSRFAAVVV